MRQQSVRRAGLPRILVMAGVVLMIVAVLATIGFVAGDSTCNSVTNLSNPGGLPASSGFCGHTAGFLAASFTLLVAGAALLIFGSMVVPTLRQRDARREEARRATAAGEETPPEPSA